VAREDQGETESYHEQRATHGGFSS
jgi:hypothetical protein